MKHTSPARLSSFLLCLILVSLHPAFLPAQVFPDMEQLDVVYLSDGSVLRGRILQEAPERYLTVEIYGGSIFTVAWENVKDQTTETNPDYGTTWIRISLDPEIPESDTETIAPARPPERPFVASRDSLARSWIVGGYSEPGFQWGSGDDWGSSGGESWSTLITSIEQEDQTLWVGGSGGMEILYLGRPVGFRTSIQYATRTMEFTTGTVTFSDGATDTDFWRMENPHGLAIPVELLLGGGTAMVHLYGGAGFGLFSGGVNSSLGDLGPEGLILDREPDNTTVYYYIISTGSVFRFGRYLYGHLRLGYDRQISSFYDEEEIYWNNVAIGFGLGYRIR